MRRIVFAAAAVLLSSTASAQIFTLKKSDWAPIFATSKPVAHGQKTIEAVPAASGQPDLKLKEYQEKIAAAYLGVGYNIWTGEPMKQPCVVPTRGEKSIYVAAKKGVPSPDNWDHVNDLSSLDEHYHNQSLSASASVTYKVFSIGGGISSSSNNHYRTYSRYIDVDKGIVTDKVILPASLQITKLAGDALHSPHPADNFTQVCGQRFVTEVMFGVAVNGTIDFQVAINDSTKSNSASVHAGVSGIVDGSLNTAQQWGDMSKTSSVRYNVKGGPSQTPEKEQWLPSIRSFGADEAVLQSEYVVLLKTASYTDISYTDFRNFKNVTDEALGTMTNLIFVQGKAVQLLTDLQVAADPNVAEFFGSTADEIKADTATLVTYVDNLSATYGLCGKAIDAAGVATCKSEATKYGTLPPVKPLVLAKQTP